MSSRTARAHIENAPQGERQHDEGEYRGSDQVKAGINRDRIRGVWIERPGMPGNSVVSPTGAK